MKIHKQGSTQMLFRVAGGNMKTCYKKVGMDGKDNEKLRCVEITPKLYDMGVTCIADERSPVSKDGMVNATYLSIGDFILVRDNGVYRIPRAEMREEYIF